MTLAPAGSDPDPRGDTDVRPVVAGPAGSGVLTGVFVLAMVILGLVLFLMLDTRRRAATAPATRSRAADVSTGPQPLPPLLVPPVVRDEAPLVLVAPAPTPTPTPLRTPAPLPPRTVYVPQPAPIRSQPLIEVPQQPVASHAGSTAPTLVYDATAAGEGATGSSAGNGTGASALPARAGVLGNRAMTVPQGTLIPAVLETAFDSTRPGLARALVSRDVRGFDGTRVLIPRGSRLVGEYRADLQPGQNRALILWTRLVRPDGVTMALASPSGDPLGRVGVRGQVDSHFLQRFGAAFLQSALDVGVALAARGGSGNVAVIGVPGTLRSNTSPLLGPAQVQPTLRVRQGTAVTVFAARDLDFSGVERAR